LADSLYKDLNQFTPSDREYSEDERAVYQAVVNIIQTRTGERLFDPTFGVDLDGYLFETMDDGIEQEILTIIAASVERIENRVQVDFGNSEVRAKPDTNTLELKLVFDILGIDEQTYQLVEAIRF